MSRVEPNKSLCHHVTGYTKSLQWLMLRQRSVRSMERLPRSSVLLSQAKRTQQQTKTRAHGHEYIAAHAQLNL